MVSRRGFLKILGGASVAAVAAPILTKVQTSGLFIPSQNLDYGVPRTIMTAMEMPLDQLASSMARELVLGDIIPMLLVHDEFQPPGWQQYGQPRVPAGTTLLVDRPTAERWVANGVGTPGPAAPLELQEASARLGMTRRREWLEPQVTEDWSPGIGMAYDAAPGVDTFAEPADWSIAWPTQATRDARDQRWSVAIERASARLKGAKGPDWWVNDAT